MNEYTGRLHECALRFPMTDLWMDSCGEEELDYGLACGIVGATSNPLIVGAVVKKELPLWQPRIREMIAQNPTASEEDIAWQLLYEVTALRSQKLLPVFQRTGGRKGRISLQTDIKQYRNSERMLAQALEIAALAPNMQVKMPANAAGIAAMEEATYQGVSINATISFTVAQAVAVAEAVERGLKRREDEGLPVEDMAPVCTIMMGRTDDWLKAYVAANGLVVAPEALEWGGIAIVKKAYGIYRQRGYRTRLLTAANRNLYHWQQLVGGNISQTINFAWFTRLNGCGAPVEDTMANPVDEGWLAALETLPEWAKSYNEDGMAPPEFERYGGFRTTLQDFLNGADNLYALVRAEMV